jgi:hypothetical protein
LPQHGVAQLRAIRKINYATILLKNIKMKYAIVLLMALGILTPAASSAQSMPTAFTDSDFYKEAAIQGAMLKVIGELQNNFEKYKGELLKKNADGNSYYAVKDLDMGTPAQYIMVNAQGVSVYIAVFSPNKLDTKLPFLGSAAFKGLDKQYGFEVRQIDTDPAKGLYKYTLRFDTLHPASFIMDVLKIQGTLVIGNQ